MMQTKKSNLIKTLYFCCLLATCILVPLLGTAQDGEDEQYRSKQSIAVSRNLNVYQQADLTSPIIGTMIFGEPITVVATADINNDSGVWRKIVSPYSGFYLDTAAGADMNKDAVDETQVNYFNAPRQIQMDEAVSKTSDEMSGMSSVDQDESVGFFTGIFRFFFSDDEEEEQEQVSDEKIEQPAETRESVEMEKETSSDETELITDLREYYSNWLTKESDRYTIGLGFSLITMPEESYLASSSTPIDVYVDFAKQYKLLSNFRFGMNNISFDGNGNQVSLMTLYGAFIVKTDQVRIEKTELFGMLGPAHMTANIGGNASGAYQGFGLVAGIGGYYRLSRKIRVGGHWLYFSNQANMGGIKVSIGSQQLQVVGSYTF